MMPSAPGIDPAPLPKKTAGTPSRGRWSLRLRLGVFIAIAIAAVIGTTTFLQFRLVEGTLEAELIDTARLSALAVADDLALASDDSDPEAVLRHLREFSESVPEIGSLSVVRMEGGQPVIFASTASASPGNVLDVGRRAIEKQDVEWGGGADRVRVLAAPFLRGGRAMGAVAVTVSFDALYRLRERDRVIAAWATLVSAVVLFGLVELLVRWLIHRPIDGIRATMRQVTSGDLAARSPVLRADEIGAVADGLNGMLSEMEDLHGGLQQRVAQATQEVRARNRELLEMYQQMFRLREELGRSQQLAAVGETAAAVAHQIGTPLNLVSGHIQLALEALGGSSPAARRLLVAEEQLHKVTAIVKDLLARSRRPLRQEAVDLGALLGRLCALVQPALEAGGITLRFDNGRVPAVDADAAQLELALLNLFSNAIDAMPGGGELAIRLFPADGRAVIEVADTGSGMPPELASRAFDPWVTTKAAGQGTGLGLSITRSVILEHGGSVHLRSAVGQGSTFTVVLPLSPPPSPAVDPHHA